MSIRHYYADTAGSAPALPTLHTALDADVCVVGGGFAGLNTALGLAERGHRDVVLLEAEQPDRCFRPQWRFRVRRLLPRRSGSAA